MNDRAVSPHRQNDSGVARSILVFCIACALLLAGVQCLRGRAPGRFYTMELVVMPAAWAARAALGEPGIRADGTRIVSATQSMAVQSGCEGADAIALLLAALIAAPARPARRLAAAASGTAALHLLNIARIAMLFAAQSRAPAWFGPLHAWVLPLLMVAAAIGVVMRALR